MCFQLSLPVSVKNLYLTDSTEQSNSWRAKIHSAGWHPSQSLKILCHMKPAHIFEIHINIILPSMPSSLKFLFSIQDILRSFFNSFLIYLMHATCLAISSPWFYLTKNYTQFTLIRSKINQQDKIFLCSNAELSIKY